MQWYRDSTGKLVADMDRWQIIAMCRRVAAAAKHDPEAKECLAKGGFLTQKGAFDWAELWQRERKRIERNGWTPVPDSELPKCARILSGVLGEPQPGVPQRPDLPFI